MNTELRKSFSELKSKCKTKSQRLAFNELIKTFDKLKFTQDQILKLFSNLPNGNEVSVYTNSITKGLMGLYSVPNNKPHRVPYCVNLLFITVNTIGDKIIIDTSSEIENGDPDKNYIKTLINKIQTKPTENYNGFELVYTANSLDEAKSLINEIYSVAKSLKII